MLKIIDFGTSRKIEPGEKLSKRLGTVYGILFNLLALLHSSGSTEQEI
jgi:hypothetical protein